MSSSTTSTTSTSTNTPILSSIPALQEQYRRSVVTQAQDDSNLHVVSSSSLQNNTSTTDDYDNNPVVLLCPMSVLLPFTFRGNPFRLPYQDAASMALAVQHLNTNNARLVPQLADYRTSNNCPNLYFTVQAANTLDANGQALKAIVDQSSLPVGTVVEAAAASTTNTSSAFQIRPCSFFGAYRSSVSLPTAIVSGILDHVQVSGSSTSTALDDKGQYPRFGRTVPSDAGNAVPLVHFFKYEWQLTKIAVINVNDAFGNAFVDAMRQAAAAMERSEVSDVNNSTTTDGSTSSTPDPNNNNLQFFQVPYDEASGSVTDVIASIRSSQFRFVFCLVFGRDAHDAIMTEAYRQGIAGNGAHQWIFGDSFPADDIRGSVLDAESPLALAYRGVGYVHIIGGAPGIPKYDDYVAAVAELQNDDDLQILDTIWPPVNAELRQAELDLRTDPNLLAAVSGFRPFSYDAAIAMGLAACRAVGQNNNNAIMTGEQHFAALRSLPPFDGVTGKVEFDNVTGTRLPDGALYRVVNFIDEPNPDNASQIVLREVVTHYFIDGNWSYEADYIFNDGTSNLPIDFPPPPPVLVEQATFWTVPMLIVIPGGLFLLLLFVILLFLRERSKRKANDTVWQVNKKELVFEEDPKVLGRGSFGLVLLAEYRGTQVAVKRVIPPADMLQQQPDGKSSMAMLMSGSNHSNSQNDDSSQQSDSLGTTSTKQMEANRMSGLFYSGTNSTVGGNQKRAQRNAWRKMRDDFVQEMRYLSRLRHPCITTVMGAVLDDQNPMLIMEYMDHGSFYDLLHNETMVLEGDVLLPLLRDITQGMRFLHAADPQVLHGDLKAANILVDSRFRAKVADFGLSQKKNLGGTGTPYWMAPELLRRETSNTSASDAFSFGVILFEVISRKDPYEGEDGNEVLRDIADPNVRKRVQPPHNMPDALKTLMADCMEEDVERRPSFEEVDIRLKRLDPEIFPTPPRKNTGQVSLFDIFPKHVAEALRDGRKVEAEQKDVVTIFFSDIVGFTNLSATLDPRKVANMLDRLYQKFDNLSHKHDIYKVETIGDAFMAVSNLVKDQSNDHAKRIAEFSIEALKAANETIVDEDDPSKGYVNIRVGFHSGSVVADVVGTRNPRYCLFGDTVNTSSRMESNSEKNRINCSKAAARILQKQSPSIHLKSRGKIDIKGKGKMTCYWVHEGEVRLEESDFMSTEFSLDAATIQDQIRKLEAKIDVPQTVEEKATSEVEASIPEQSPAGPVSSSVRVTYGSNDASEDLHPNHMNALETSLGERLKRNERPAPDFFV